MRILIVDDSKESQQRLAAPLNRAEFGELIYAPSASEAFRILGIEGNVHPAGVDLILMDVSLPGIDGLSATQRIKAEPRLRDIPLILVMEQAEPDVLKRGLDAGAIDFIVRPFQDIEILARVLVGLRLKLEMDARKARERELNEVREGLERANRELERLSSIDGLTGVANRRLFDRRLTEEWERARRDGSELGLLMIDVDHFKAFNDAGGHQSGDDCLKRAAAALAGAVKRTVDLVARYGGEEFAVLLPGRALPGAVLVAEQLRKAVEDLAIPHPKSTVGPRVTISAGAASLTPAPGIGPAALVAAADRALYRAKEGGRNTVRSAQAAPAEARKVGGSEGRSV